MRPIAALALAALALPTGCGRLAPIPRGRPPAAGAGSEVAASDERCRVTLPPGWTRRDPDGNATLRAASEGGLVLFRVMPTPKAELAAGETYRDHARQYLTNLGNQPVLSDVAVAEGPADVTINGRPAVRYKVHAVLKQEKTKVVYLCAAVDGKETVYLLVGSVVDWEFARQRADLEAVVNSFRETD